LRSILASGPRARPKQSRQRRVDLSLGSISITMVFIELSTPIGRESAREKAERKAAGFAREGKGGTSLKTEKIIRTQHRGQGCMRVWKAVSESRSQPGVK